MSRLETVTLTFHIDVSSKQNANYDIKPKQETGFVFIVRGYSFDASGQTFFNTKDIAGDEELIIFPDFSHDTDHMREEAVDRAVIIVEWFVSRKGWNEFEADLYFKGGKKVFSWT